MAEPRQYRLETDQDVVNMLIALADQVNVEQWETDFAGVADTPSGDTGLPMVDEIATAIRSLQRAARQIRRIRE